MTPPRDPKSESDETRWIYYEGQRVLISEVFLKRRFPGWTVPYVQWHVATVIDDGEFAAIPQHLVSVATSDLTDKDVLILSPTEQRKLTTPMTLSSLAEKARAAQAAAPGMLRVVLLDHEWRVTYNRDSVYAETGGYPIGEPVAEFIAAASPGVVLGLIEEVERLRSAHPCTATTHFSGPGEGGGNSSQTTVIIGHGALLDQVRQLRAALKEACALYERAECFGPTKAELARVTQLAKLGEER